MMEKVYDTFHNVLLSNIESVRLYYTAREPSHGFFFSYIDLIKQDRVTLLIISKGFNISTPAQLLCNFQNSSSSKSI